MKKNMLFGSLLSHLMAALLATAAFVQAEPKNTHPYVGRATGVNTLAGTTPEGASIFVNTAREISNFGGPVSQDNTVIIVPVFDAAGAISGFVGYGFAVSHKPDGDVIVEYVLEQELSGRYPGAFTGTFAIVGGTGRYAGATGGGRIKGLDRGDGSFQNEYQGTITLVTVATPKP